MGLFLGFFRPPGPQPLRIPDTRLGCSSDFSAPGPHAGPGLPAHHCVGLFRGFFDSRVSGARLHGVIFRIFSEPPGRRSGISGVDCIGLFLDFSDSSSAGPFEPKRKQAGPPGPPPSVPKVKLALPGVQPNRRLGITSRRVAPRCAPSGLRRTPLTTWLHADAGARLHNTGPRGVLPWDDGGAWRTTATRVGTMPAGRRSDRSTHHFDSITQRAAAWLRGRLTAEQRWGA